MGTCSRSTSGARAPSTARFVSGSTSASATHCAQDWSCTPSIRSPPFPRVIELLERNEPVVDEASALRR